MFKFIKGKMVNLSQSIVFGYDIARRNRSITEDEKTHINETLFADMNNYLYMKARGELFKDSIITYYGDMPVWCSFVPDECWYELVSVFGETIYGLGKIQPFTTSLIKTLDYELLGFIIVIPESFHIDDDLCKFVIGHELGHIMSRHLIGDKAGVLNDIEKEKEADRYAVEYTGFDIEKCRKLMKDVFDLVFRTTYLNIPSLKNTKDIDAKVELIRNSNKNYRQRSKAL